MITGMYLKVPPYPLIRLMSGTSTVATVSGVSATALKKRRCRVDASLSSRPVMTKPGLSS